MRDEPTQDARVRAAIKDDAEVLGRLWMEFMHELSAIDARFHPSGDAAERWRNDFRGWLASDSRRIFVAEVQGKPEGFLSIERIFSPPIYRAVPEAIVAELYVTPSNRRIGCARRMFAAAQRWCEERGIQRLRADVLSRNQNALDFFSGEGADSFAQTLWLELAPPSDDGAPPESKRIGFS